MCSAQPDDHLNGYCGNCHDWTYTPFMRHPDGRVDLTRLANGRVMCQLCFGYFTTKELHETEPGLREDVCIRCAREEAVTVAAIALGTLVRVGHRLTVALTEFIALSGSASDRRRCTYCTPSTPSTHVVKWRDRPLRIYVCLHHARSITAFQRAHGIRVGCYRYRRPQ